jgi:hypothetical protein
MRNNLSVGVRRVRPSRAKHAVAPRYNRWHISQGFGAKVLRIECYQMISAFAPDRPDEHSSSYVRGTEC